MQACAAPPIATPSGRPSSLPPSISCCRPRQAEAEAPAMAPRFSMRVASKQAYICRDCGYIYKDRTPFEKLLDKFFCPVCGAPKSRFRPYEPTVAKNANDTEVRKARKAELKRDEAIGRALPVAIVLQGWRSFISTATMYTS